MKTTRTSLGWQVWEKEPCSLQMRDNLWTVGMMTDEFKYTLMPSSADFTQCLIPQNLCHRMLSSPPQLRHRLVKS